MKTILVTGANRGLGLELVKQYYEEGWHVIACVRQQNTDKLDQLAAKKTDGKITVYSLDVTNPVNIEQLSRRLNDMPIDILFNNAGIWGPGNTHFGDVISEPWLDVFKVNTIAPLLLAQSFIHHINRSKLKIIANMSSGMGSIQKNTDGNVYIYRSSKAALNAVTKSMAIDLKEQDITVISLDPGWVKTDMGGFNAQITPKESIEGIKKVLSTLTLKDSGIFIKYTGEKVAW